MTHKKEAKINEKRLLFRNDVLRSSTVETPVISAFSNISTSVVTQASARGVYMFTAFKRILAENKTKVFVNGWEDRPLRTPNVFRHCCFLLPNNAIVQGPVASSVRFIYNPQLVAVLYECNTPKIIEFSEEFAVSMAVVEKLQSAPAAKKTLPKKPVQPQQVKNPAPQGQDNGTAPVKDPVKKPVPPKRAKKPVPPSRVKKPVPAAQNPGKPDPVNETYLESEKQILPNGIAQKTAEESGNKTENASQNTGASSRKLLSLDNGKNETNNVNIAIANAESDTVIGYPVNLVCPTDHNSYILPLKAIVVNNDKNEAPPGGGEKPVKQAKVPSNTNLKVADNKAVKTEKSFSFAICAKIIYGSADVELTIEWMEYYRHMGASKVLAFTYNLTAEATTLIKHYEDTGFLEVMPFNFPRPDSPNRNVGQKNAQAWNDEHVLIYHCHDRLFNYKFVGIIDFDEFIVPHKDRNFKDLFDRLLKSQKTASDFMLPHMVHVQEWNRTKNDSLKIGSYLDHTKNLGYNMKTVYMPDRVPEGGLHTHGLLKRIPGYRTIHVLGNIAQLSHYRKKCRPEWVKKQNCFNKTLVRTTRILELVDGDLRTMIEKKKVLLLPNVK